MIFRLTWGLISGKLVPATDTSFPGFDRHHGPPLAGFAVSVVWFSRLLVGRRGESPRQFASLH
jgi:hypothetical protein